MKQIVKLSFMFFLGLNFLSSLALMAEDINALKAKAEQGDADAQKNLGWMYYDGEGVPEDKAEAAQWYRKAAEQGDADAQSQLGFMYYNGEGVSADKAVAAQWCRKAAEQGDADAQRLLGFMYSKGEGVPKDKAEAARWYRKAAEQGDAYAQWDLGEMYSKGEGVPQNKVEAAQWYRKAAERGDAYEQLQLGLMYDDGDGVPQDKKEAARWYRKAAERGIGTAQFNLGLMYSNGEGVPQDKKEAVRWYRKAAEQGHASAQWNLGLLYRYGEGVLKDELEGLAWLYLAKSNGFVGTSGQNMAIIDIETKVGRGIELLAQQRAREIGQAIESKQSTVGIPKSGTGRDVPKNVPDEPTGNGTGAFVSAHGLVLTAAHVVVGASSVKVRTEQGVLPAKIVQIDEANDIALLKCEGSFTPLKVTNSRPVRIGQSVFTIGFPQTDIQGFSPKFTKGDVSSISGIMDDPRHWQISVPVQPGNSGGPLLDESGNVVGVVVAQLNAGAFAEHTGTLPQNVNYAVKSAYVRPLLEEHGVNFSNAPQAAPQATSRMEDVVARVKKSIVLILTY
jgi:TPR repeat protein